MNSLGERVKAEARRLGFHLAGITSAEKPAHFEVYEAWLSADLHGEMAYLASEAARRKRADPRQILPECQSILVLGMRYPSPKCGFVGEIQSDARPPEPPGEVQVSVGPLGRVASYAWGDDYHDLFSERLQALAAFIETQIGHPVPHRWYTDTGPVLERDLAQRAGLGWIGKNTCLIHPRLGSYFLLAEILLGLELDPDPPFPYDFCGSCTRCLDACPTACILPNRTIDARRCISYLTIEFKGVIPNELRSRMGEWVFGCDICQEVCPWNQRFADPQGEAERQAVATFVPRPGVPRPRLVEELLFTSQAFNRKFKGSPVMRAKRRGYLRNAVVALGNALAGRSPQETVTALRDALLHDPEPLVRVHTAWALGRISSAAARQALEEALSTETDPSVLAEILTALTA